MALRSGRGSGERGISHAVPRLERLARSIEASAEKVIESNRRRYNDYKGFCIKSDYRVD